MSGFTLSKLMLDIGVRVLVVDDVLTIDEEYRVLVAFVSYILPFIAKFF